MDILFQYFSISKIKKKLLTSFHINFWLFYHFFPKYLSICRKKILILLLKNSQKTIKTHKKPLKTEQTIKN
jgi:hypothetical protein